MPSVAVNRETQRFRWRGITLTAVPANWAGKTGESAIEGVYIVGIEDAEMAKKLGVKQGQVIRAISGKVIKSIAELQKVIDSIPLDEVKLEITDSASVATAQGN
jgi:S1-C subfamily serine protease